MVLSNLNVGYLILCCVGISFARELFISSRDNLFICAIGLFLVWDIGQKGSHIQPWFQQSAIIFGVLHK